MVESDAEAAAQLSENINVDDVIDSKELEESDQGTLCQRSLLMRLELVGARTIFEELC